MENRSVAKLSTKKALSSLRSFLCCNGNDEDKLNLGHAFLPSSPIKDKSLDDFDVSAFVNKFLAGQICCHGNPGSVCVSCCLNSNHGNLDDYIITRPNAISDEKCCYENWDAISPDSCVKEPIFVYDNQSFCECCEQNNDDFEDHDYENIPNSFSDKQLQVTFDTDNASLCSSCYHSNCTMCREEEESYVINGDRTEFSVECSTPNFDAEGLRKLLRQLNPNIPVTCIHGNYGNASELLCCQAEEIVSMDTVSTGKSKNDKDSGVGRTDDSTKNDESSEQELPECTSPGHDVDPDHHCSNDSFTSQSTTECVTTEDQLIRECDRFRQALEQRCGINFQDDVFKVANQNGATPCLKRVDSQSSIEREIRALNEEMKKIQLECQEIVDAHKNDPVKETTFDASKPETRSSPNRVVPRMGTRLDYGKQLQLQQELQDPIWIPRDLSTHAQKSPQVASAQKPNIILPLGEKTALFACAHHNATTQAASHTLPEQGNHIPRKAEICSKAGSSRSAPLTLELSQSVKPSLSSKTTPYNGELQNSVDDSAESKCSVSKSISNSSVNQITQTPEPSAETLQELYSQYADVMYTNQANLQHTMMLQQKLFQQKLSQQQCALSNGSSHSVPRDVNNTPRDVGDEQTKETQLYDNSPLNHNQTNSGMPLGPYSSLNQMRQGDSSGTNTSNVQMEWVVKRRADGTRYITRRPMRSKMLKERARKISEERAGMTTDDDAMSELKVGRYWSKDERKRHVEKAREYKRRKQEMLRQRMETVKENDDQKREPSILELSQRKMMKHKSRKMFDDFTTVQEMLAHGSRNTKAPIEAPPTTGGAPLLSVTTV